MIDDCSFEESTALLAISVRKLNTDILLISLVHCVSRFSFFDAFSSGDKRPSWNAWAFLIQFVACR